MKKERRSLMRRALRKAGVAAIIVLILFVGLGALSHIKDFSISGVSVSGTTALEPNVVKSATLQELSGSTFLLYDRSNRFIYPKGAIKEALAERIPRLKEIALSVEGGVLNVSVIEYDGAYLWCGNHIPEAAESIRTECYFVDETGYIFDRAPYFSGDVYFKFYGGTVPDLDPIGSRVESPGVFAELVKFKDFLPEIGVTSASFFLADSGKYELYLKSLDSPGIIPKLIFNRGDSFERVLNNFNTVLAAEPFAEEFEASFDSLEYIDLRYEDQVFYKFSD